MFERNITQIIEFGEEIRYLCRDDRYDKMLDLYKDEKYEEFLQIISTIRPVTDREKAEYVYRFNKEMVALGYRNKPRRIFAWSSSKSRKYLNGMFDNKKYATLEILDDMDYDEIRPNYYELVLLIVRNEIAEKLDSNYVKTYDLINNVLLTLEPKQPLNLMLKACVLYIMDLMDESYEIFMNLIDMMIEFRYPIDQTLDIMFTTALLAKTIMSDSSAFVFLKHIIANSKNAEHIFISYLIYDKKLDRNFLIDYIDSKMDILSYRELEINVNEIKSIANFSLDKTAIAIGNKRDKSDILELYNRLIDDNEALLTHITLAESSIKMNNLDEGFEDYKKIIHGDFGEVVGYPEILSRIIEIVRSYGKIFNIQIILEIFSLYNYELLIELAEIHFGNIDYESAGLCFHNHYILSGEVISLNKFEKCKNILKMIIDDCN